MKKIILLVSLLFVFFGTSTLSAQSYDNAVGLRVAWGFGGTYKHFFSEKVAGEGIVNYWSRGTIGFRYSQTRIAGLVEIHNDLSDVLDGLQWYAGGGAFAQFSGGNYSQLIDYNQTQIGISGVLGLDYAFADLPINVSLDWMPSFAISGGSGFLSRAGGIAIRYTF